MRIGRIFAVFALLVVAFGNTGIASAKTTFSWQPERVDITVDRGSGPISQVVTATANKRLTNVTVVIVPELSRFITVTPSTISVVDKGEQFSFVLGISVPSSELIGLYSGTIHLVVRSKTISLPLPVTINASEDVGAEGAVITSKDGRATLAIPPGAILGDPLRFTMERVPLSDFSLPDMVTLLDPAYDIGPDGAVFSEPLILTLHYDPTDIPLGSLPESLRIGFENEFGNIVILDSCSVNTTLQTVSCPVLHFTRFMITMPEDMVSPNPPTNVSAVVLNDLVTVEISWTNPTDGDFSHIKIYRSFVEGILGSVLATDIAVSFYEDTMEVGLNCYTVRSVDFSGNESTNTDQVCAERDSAPPSSDVFYLSTLQGNPGVPGDNIVTTCSAGCPFGKIFQPAPPFSLFGTTDGITATVFPETTNPETVVGFLEVHFSIPESSCGVISPFGFNTSVGPVVNNVRGYFTNVSQSLLNNMVAFTQSFGGACASVMLDDFAITGVIMSDSIDRNVFFTELDALAVGFGENMFPTETTPSP